MRKIITVISFAILACASQAATLWIYSARVNAERGDVVQYKLPGENWKNLNPAYYLNRVFSVPDDVIVVTRVYNTYQNRTISIQAKATWKRSAGGDADSNGNVIFQLTGSG